MSRWLEPSLRHVGNQACDLDSVMESGLYCVSRALAVVGWLGFNGAGCHGDGSLVQFKLCQWSESSNGMPNASVKFNDFGTHKLHKATSSATNCESSFD